MPVWLWQEDQKVLPGKDQAMSQLRTPIAERIAKHFTAGMKYTDLEGKVFPPAEYPRAWRYATGGGPPACRRTLVAHLHKNGYQVLGGYLGDRHVYRKDST